MDHTTVRDIATFGVVLSAYVTKEVTERVINYRQYKKDKAKKETLARRVVMEMQGLVLYTC